MGGVRSEEEYTDMVSSSMYYYGILRCFDGD